MRIRDLALAGGLLAMVGPAAAQEACGRYPAPQETYSCNCATVDLTALIWGSGPYTTDSDLCTAAVHAGVIGPEGGPVVARLIAGESSYPASSANGVTSQRWGRYDSSIAFDPPAAPVTAPVRPALPTFTTARDTPSAPAAGGEEVCTGLNFDAVETVCRCEPGQGTGATVWGSGPYVAGSDLCAAARHAEVIGLDGGVIAVIRLPGLTSYRGSERGGIKSEDWEEYNESFVVNAN